MTPEEQVQLQQSVQTIAEILYRNTPSEQLQTLEGIEQTIREQTQQHVLPQWLCCKNWPRSGRHTYR